MPYAIARQIDPGTGDVVMNGATWAYQRPLTAMVLGVLRTPLGSYLPDITYGLDYSRLQKMTPSIGADFQAALTQALRFLTSKGQLKNLRVTYSTTGTALIFNVTFTDPRDPSNPPSISGALSSGVVTQLQVT